MVIVVFCAVAMFNVMLVFVCSGHLTRRGFSFPCTNAAVQVFLGRSYLRVDKSLL